MFGSFSAVMNFHEVHEDTYLVCHTVGKFSYAECMSILLSYGMLSLGGEELESSFVSYLKQIGENKCGKQSDKC